VAVDPPEDARADLAAALSPLQGLPGEPRWTLPERWHLTLLFLEGDLAPLTDLAKRLSRVARGLRLEVEDRPFRPHLTVGRWRPGRPADGTVIDRLAGYRGPEWPVTDVRLLESHLGPKPAYDELATWPVG
jgi:2'-5' RNA ligase